jgi:uncharacterized membrane protein YfcA
MSGDEIAIVVAAVLLGALVKSITGMGLPLVAIPIMALFVSTETAVAVMAIPNVAQNLVLAVRHRHARHESRRLLQFCGASVIGAGVGALSLGLVADWVTRLVLVTMVAGYIVTTLVAPDVRIGDERERRAAAPLGLLAGVFQGGIGISGPIVGSWFHGLRLSADAFVFSISTAFLIAGATQSVVFGVRGTLDGRITVSVLLSVLVVATIPLGSRLRRRLSIETFRRLVLLLLAGSCAGMTVDLIGQLM